MKKLAAMLCLAAMLGACGTGYRKLDWMQTGYKDTQVDFNNYLVSYRGSDLEFCKQAALYRVAELCKEQGFAYFKIKSEQVISDFVGRSRNPVQAPGSTVEYLVENSSGLERKTDVDGYSYRVEFLKNRPESAGVFSVDDLLKRGIPGEEKAPKKTGVDHGK